MVRRITRIELGGILLGVLALSGCGEMSDPPGNNSTHAQEMDSPLQLEQNDVMLLVESANNGGMDSELHGLIAINSEGCIGVATPGEKFIPVIFPLGTTFDPQAKNDWRGVDPGGFGFGVGEDIFLAGGFVLEADLVPSRCEAGPEGVFSSWKIVHQ